MDFIWANDIDIGMQDSLGDAGIDLKLGSRVKIPEHSEQGPRSGKLKRLCLHLWSKVLKFVPK